MLVDQRFPTSAILAADGPLVALRNDARGQSLGAVAARIIRAPVDRVWPVVSDVGAFAGRIPLVERADRAGDHVVVKLRFGLSLFSVGFSFKARVTLEEQRVVDLTHVSGEPDKLVIRYELEPVEEGRSTQVHAGVTFDVDSVGWLAKYFLRHQPAIRFGIFPGCAVSLVESMKAAVESSTG